MPTTDKCSPAREERAGSSHPCAMPGMRSLSVDRAEVTTPGQVLGRKTGSGMEGREQSRLAGGSLTVCFPGRSQGHAAEIRAQTDQLQVFCRNGVLDL